MTNNTYTLQVDLEPTATGNVAVTLYAANRSGFMTGLMNANKLSAYVDETLLAEDSTDPLVVTKHEAKWLIFSILEDWDSWNDFIKEDMEDQDYD
jgi:hypothetical protein